MKEAVLSPNGKYICYRKRGLNQNDICAEVIVSSIDGKEVSRCQYEELYSDQYDILSVSNDGTTVFLLNSIGDVSCVYKGEWDEKADLIYQQDSGLDLSAAYDLYTDKLYFVKGRKTLFSIDSDENIKTITDECTEVKPIDDFYKYVTYTDFDISDYSIIFDNYVKKEY